MAEIDLKEYTSRAKELEAAIFTQKCLIQRYEEVLKEQLPIAPQMRKVPKPVKPDPDHYRIYKQLSPVWISIIAMYILGIFSLYRFFLGEFVWIVGVVFAVFAFLLTIEELGMSREIATHNRELAEEYRQAEREYLSQVKEYNRQLELAQNEYEQALADYDKKTEKHNESRNTVLHYHNLALDALKTARQALYRENVIFPKYRDLVAIATINEYLLSGRCTGLEGPDGAYNLYEQELRQNIVVGQMPEILNDPEKIRCNQFLLYEQLRRSNGIIGGILREVREDCSNAGLIAYFSANITLAETPR